jgi:hypothetical protein
MNRRDRFAGQHEAPGSGGSKRKAAFAASLFLVAFMTNFFWESAHGLLYAGNREMPAAIYVPKIGQAALLDALSLLGLYLLTALISRRFIWRPAGTSLAVFTLSALCGAWVVEYVAVSVLHAWAYTPAMPQVFGAGVSPLLQLPLTGLAALFAARRLTGFFNEQE